MNTNNTPLSFAGKALVHYDVEDIHTLPMPRVPPSFHQPSSFWQGRLIELGLVLSMALYYIIGNPNLPLSQQLHTRIFAINPVYSLPFLFLFIVLSWFRLPFAVALLPLSLPYYLLQKTVLETSRSHYNFSIAEITLGACLLVALLQIGVSIARGKRWRYWPTWNELLSRIRPVLIPTLIFLLAAACSVVIAYNRTTAFRAFREEVFDPLVYMLLALACLRSRQDVSRLVIALFSSGVIIALLGIIQFVFFKNSLHLEDGVRRVAAVYGSANSIGLLFDYTLPLGIALCLSRVSIRLRVLSLMLSLPFLPVLYLTNSRGAWVALTASTLFIIVFSIRSHKVRIAVGIVLAVVIIIATLFFRSKVIDFVVQGHTSQDHGYTTSTVTKRVYLWESALHMIHDSPWLGYGMDNWLCHYSNNAVCPNHNYHYWIVTTPSGHPTGLKDEPDLSHPHNIFLHIWVSMGIFGLLAFITIIITFYWQFVRILRQLKKPLRFSVGERSWLYAITIGIGASMLAALVQGQIDSSFLEQDLAFCFWGLVIALLLTRTLVIYVGSHDKNG